MVASQVVAVADAVPLPCSVAISPASVHLWQPEYRHVASVTLAPTMLSQARFNLTGRLGPGLMSFAKYGYFVWPEITRTVQTKRLELSREGVSRPSTEHLPRVSQHVLFYIIPFFESNVSFRSLKAAPT